MIRKINFPITEIPYWYVNFNEDVPYEFTVGDYRVVDEIDTLGCLMLKNPNGEVYNDHVREGDVIFSMYGVLHCLPKDIWERCFMRDAK